MSIYDKILTQPEFQSQPPVLIDLGASGGVNAMWEEIAKYCVCISFDADTRDLQHTFDESDRFRKMYVYNAIVSDRPQLTSTFYLTASPHCSSTLFPQHQQLQNWDFYHLFDIQQTIELKTVTLPDILSELNITQVDWFKADTQGTDLRLFHSMGTSICKRVLLAQFEPQIIDSYVNEDKFHHVLRDMEILPFWISRMDIVGVKRMNLERIGKLNSDSTEILKQFQRKSPGWSGIYYLNRFEQNEAFKAREFLLGCAFSLLEKQYAFALELCARAYEQLQDERFVELSQHINEEIKRQIIQQYFKNVNGKPMSIYGAGTYGLEVLKMIRFLGFNVERFYDKDEQKWSSHIEGIPIADPETISNQEYIVIASEWVDEISAYLTARGLKYKEQFVEAGWFDWFY